MLLLTLLTLLTTCHGAEIATNIFGSRITRGQTSGQHYSYITGMSASRVHNNLMWMVTSRSNEPYLYAVDIMSGDEVAYFNVTNHTGYDWEDMAYGPCQTDIKGTYCIYIADIGNHGRDGAHDTIYMLNEPAYIGARDGTVFTDEVGVVDTVTFTWGEPDAETLMVAPDGRMFVVSKVDNGRAMLAEVPKSGWGDNVVNINESNTAILKLLTKHHDPQGGDISPGGNEIILVGEEDTWYYSITGGDYITSVNYQVPQKVATYVSGVDTEAVSWNADGSGFYTFSRSADQFLYFYHRNSGAAVVG